MTEDEVVREFYDPPELTPSGLTEDEIVREFYDPPELTQDESIREFYDPPYNPPSKTRPRLERVMKIKPDLKVMPIQLPNSTRMSNAQGVGLVIVL